MTTVKLANGKELKFLKSKLHLMQMAIINQFLPRFAPESELVYVSENTNNDYIDNKLLKMLDITISLLNNLTDVVLYDKTRRWIFLIDIVASSGTISSKKIIELEKTLKNCDAGKIYVSACQGFKEFNKHTSDIAWGTEVWLMDFPEHMIHFNGDKFIGPR